jgi:uncharacterized protein involved in exopolysaccharide biosynthesis
MCVRNQKLLIRAPLIALAIGAVVYLFAPRTYRSEAKIFLRLGRESVGLDPTATTGQTLALQQADRKDEVKSAIEVFKSRSIIGDAVDKLTPDVVLGRSKGFSLIGLVTAPLRLPFTLLKWIDPVSDREEAIIRIERHLYVNAERESNVIVVQYDASSPKLAQEVCDAMVESYRQGHMRIHRSEESRPFFAEQQERLRSELDGALERVRNTKNELGITTVEQRRASLEAQFNAVELDRLTTEQQLATSQARIADLERRLGETPERLVAEKKSVPNQGADLLRQQLYALQVKVMELQAKYKDTHPLLVAAKEQLAQAKAEMARQVGERTETTDNINTIYRDLSLELKREQGVTAGLKARQRELAHQKESVLASLQALNGQEIKIDQLARQADLARDKYMQYSRNMEEARIDQALENEKISNVSIVQSATLAEKPVSPSKPLVIAATLMLAIAGTIGLVLANERYDLMKVVRSLTAKGDGNIVQPRPRVVARRRNGRAAAAPQPQPPA